MQGTPVFLTAMISSIIIAFKKGNIKNIYPMFFVIGGITCFVDFLTTPIITLGLPLIIYFLCIQKQTRLDIVKIIKIIATASINWLIGYALIWFTKWALVDAIYGRDLIETSIGQIFFRADISKCTFIATVNRNLEPIIMNITVITFVTFIITIIRLIKNRNQIGTTKEIIQNILPYAIIMLMPFVWYFVVRRHSYEHRLLFAYRNLLLLLAGIPLIALKITEKSDKQEKILDKEKKN